MVFQCLNMLINCFFLCKNCKNYLNYLMINYLKLEKYQNKLVKIFYLLILLKKIFFTCLLKLMFI